MNRFGKQWIFYDEADDAGGGDPAPEGDAPKGSWTDQLRGENKTDPYFKQFTHFDEVALRAKQLDGELEALKGRVAVPGEDATDEEKAAYYKAIGVPEDYDLTGKKLGKMEISGEYETALKDGLKKGKFTTEQAETVLEILNGVVGSVEKAGKAFFDVEAKKADQVFRKEWGEEYNEKKNGIRKLMLQYGGQDYLKAMDETGLGNHPDQVRFLANLYDVLRDHPLLTAKSTPGAGKKDAVGLRYPSMENVQ